MEQIKNKGNFIVVGIVVLMLGIGSITAFAASLYGTPAELVANLTGREVEEVVAERARTGVTYGTMAKDAGVLDEFRGEMLKMKRAILSERVAAGTLTQEEADDIAAIIASHEDKCDGSGRGWGLDGVRCGLGVGLGHNRYLQEQKQECVQGRDQFRSQDCTENCPQGPILAPAGERKQRSQSRRVPGQIGQGHGGHGLGACLRDGSCGK